MSVTAFASLLEVIGAAFLIVTIPAGVIRYLRRQYSAYVALEYGIPGALMLLLGLVLHWSIAHAPRQVVTTWLFVLVFACVLLILYVSVMWGYFPARVSNWQYWRFGGPQAPRRARWIFGTLGAVAWTGGTATLLLPTLGLLILALLACVLAAAILTALRGWGRNPWIVKWYGWCMGALLIPAIGFSVAIDLYPF